MFVDPARGVTLDRLQAWKSFWTSVAKVLGALGITSAISGWLGTTLKGLFAAKELFTADNRASESHFTIGKIHYPDGREPGTLIYIKPSLSPTLPKDILAYARLKSTFPHQSTVDQFFDEAQFESYRALGLACAGSALETIKLALVS
jgi:hypothetical protein